MTPDVIHDMEEYLALCRKGAHREALAFLRGLMVSQPYLAEVGDLHVMCANLELTLDEDIAKARESLDRARELGCRDMASYYRAHGFVLCQAGVCHPCGGRGPADPRHVPGPAYRARSLSHAVWIPACAGMTESWPAPCLPMRADVCRGVLIPREARMVS